ncbi:MAG: hypothetical protein ABI321_03895 [Polyangia bacterium]
MTLAHAVAVVYRLESAEPARMRRVRNMAALLLLPALAAVVLAAMGHWGAGTLDQLLELDLTLLVPLLPILLLGPAIADELERGTAGFLFVRPIPRAALLLGRLAAALPMLLGAASLGLVVAFVALYAKFVDDLPRALPHVLAAGFALVAGLVLYSLLALGLGATFRKRPVATLIVLLLVDGGMARMPLGLQLVAPAHHLRVLAGLPELAGWAPPFRVPYLLSVAYLLSLVVATAFFGASRMNRIEMTGESM